jgi:hypothetical protein
MIQKSQFWGNQIRLEIGEHMLRRTKSDGGWCDVDDFLFRPPAIVRADACALFAERAHSCTLN